MRGLIMGRIVVVIMVVMADVRMVNEEEALVQSIMVAKIGFMALVLAIRDKDMKAVRDTAVKVVAVVFRTGRSRKRSRARRTG
ncbi:MAG: hypothetical protein M1812_002696 [Candelaria pacifica]|nr:MAG: hypothetical protein M1812_002696 [Candelaria pacifica]